MSEEMNKYLSELIKLQSVSSDPSKKSESLKTANFIISKLESLGATTKLVRSER